MSDHQNYRSIRLAVTGSLNFAGSLGITFHGEKIFIDLPATVSVVQSQLQRSQKFENVRVNYHSAATAVSTHTFTFIFLSWPIFPKENNLYSLTGDPSITDFTCDTTYLDSSVSCQFTDVETSYLRGISCEITLLISLEYDYCSNNGVCDFKTGTCTCNDGYGGLHCEKLLFPASKVGHEVSDLIFLVSNSYSD